MSSEDVNRLRLLLERLADAEDSYPVPQVEQVAFDVRDCRLELIRKNGAELSEEQLHNLQQLDFRLDGVREGKLAWDLVPELARQTLEAFGWNGKERSNRP